MDKKKTLTTTNTHAIIKEFSYRCLLDLSSTEGIYASSKSEAYGCVFGRDSALTILKLLRVYEKSKQKELLDISYKGLKALIDLQGKTFNLESGEEPGKFIHEFRRDNYDRLLNRPKPWYVYPDGLLKNYDSIDSTPLGLIGIYKYWQTTKDNEFLLKSLNAVEAGLNWIIGYGDRDKDFLVEYTLPAQRVHGGLVVQSWTDSRDSLSTTSGQFPDYPIAAVEVQAYAWLALKVWADFYDGYSVQFARKLRAYAGAMKKKFNTSFLFRDGKNIFAGQAIDGRKALITTVTGNPLLGLWASYSTSSQTESIIEEKYIPEIVARVFEEDLFDKDAGIRTMSIKSPTFNPEETSYHNGSFWPILNGMIHEGLDTWGFKTEAAVLKEATLKPIAHFGTPIELYIKVGDQDYKEYVSPRGKKGCRYQAWTAAATLDLLR